MGMQEAISPLGETTVDILVCGPAASGHCPSGAVLRTTSLPPFLVVLDREDDVRFTRTPLAAHAVRAGRVVVHPTVAGSGRLLWHDVLDVVANGRHLRAPAPATRGAAQRKARAVCAAVEAVAIRQLTVFRGHRIGW